MSPVRVIEDTEADVWWARVAPGRLVPFATEAEAWAAIDGVPYPAVPVDRARYPLAPLRRAVELIAGRPVSVCELAEQLGNRSARSAVHRAARVGLTATMADRWAVELGFHPCEIWGEDWWAGAGFITETTR